MPIYKNAPNSLHFPLYYANGALAPGLGNDIPACIAQDTGPQATPAGSVVEVGLGEYRFDGTADDWKADAVGLIFMPTAAGVVPASISVRTELPVAPTYVIPANTALSIPVDLGIMASAYVPGVNVSLTITERTPGTFATYSLTWDASGLSGGFALTYNGTNYGINPPDPGHDDWYITHPGDIISTLEGLGAGISVTGTNGNMTIVDQNASDTWSVDNNGGSSLTTMATPTAEVQTITPSDTAVYGSVTLNGNVVATLLTAGNIAAAVGNVTVVGNTSQYIVTWPAPGPQSPITVANNTLQAQTTNIQGEYSLDGGAVVQLANLPTGIALTQWSQPLPALVGNTALVSWPAIGRQAVVSLAQVPLTQQQTEDAGNAAIAAANLATATALNAGVLTLDNAIGGLPVPLTANQTSAAAETGADAALGNLTLGNGTLAAIGNAANACVTTAHGEGNYAAGGGGGDGNAVTLAEVQQLQYSSMMQMLQATLTANTSLSNSNETLTVYYGNGTPFGNFTFTPALPG